MESNFSKFNDRIRYLESHLVTLLSEIDGLKGEFKGGLKLTPQAVLQLKKSVIVTSAGASTRIEGSKLSDEDVERIMKGISISQFIDRDTQEVQGYLETLQNVFDSYKTLPLREGVIQNLHRELLKYSTKDELHRGKYKQQENLVGVLNEAGNIAQVLFDTTPAWLTQKQMQELVEWAQISFQEKQYHPLLIISNFIVEFLKIHPFQDGNGRLSRVLTNLLLLQADYSFVLYASHEQIIEQRKDEYYLALRKSQETFGTDHETIIPWLNFFLSVIREQAYKVLGYLQENSFEKELSSKQLLVWQYILSVKDTSPQEAFLATGISYSTIRQIFAKFLKLGKIEKRGLGSATRYILKEEKPTS